MKTFIVGPITVFLMLFSAHSVFAVNSVQFKFNQLVVDLFDLNTEVVNGDADLYYFIKGNYSRPITLEALEKANSLADLISYYPSKWIAEYTAVELSTSKSKVVFGADETLTIDQKEALKALHYNDNFQLIINYISYNAVNNEKIASKMNYNITVIPAVEAVCSSGVDQLVADLKTKSLLKFSYKELADVKNAVIDFVVSESGGIEKVNMMTTSGSVAIDLFMVDLIKGMSGWTPAKDQMGNPVTQNFQFMMGNFSEIGC